MTRLLHEYVTRQAEQRGDGIALALNADTLTYGELEESSNRLAHLLKELGCQPGERVCLLLPKTPQTISTMLGVLKADCVYIPIESTSPAARVEKIVRASAPRILLTSSAAGGLLEGLSRGGALDAGIIVGSVDEEPIALGDLEPRFSRADWDVLAPEPLSYEASSDDVAHILFTSGSTGTPKGVMITHSNVIHFVEWATRYFGSTPSDRISGHPPLHFDLSTFDIYGTFSVGAELHLVPERLNLLPHKLADFIRTRELTQWFSVPSTLTYMAKFDVVQPNDFPTLERLLWCGEVLPTPTLIYWMQRLPHVQFTNLYGPTEATIASSYYTVRARPPTERETIPIGTACDGEELLVLDEHLRPLRAGDVGDLYISGVGLSPGYWRDEEKTRGVFLQDPRSADPSARIYRTGDLARVGNDGLFYFLGRADTQIKSRGYRIELGEIESALNAFRAVKECAVVAVPTDEFEGNAICCAYAPTPEADLPPSALRRDLANVLPGYMIPTRWLLLDELPKNANGKIDRKRLRDVFEEKEPDASIAAASNAATRTGEGPVTG